MTTFVEWLLELKIQSSMIVVHLVSPRSEIQPIMCGTSMAELGIYVANERRTPLEIHRILNRFHGTWMTFQVKSETTQFRLAQHDCVNSFVSRFGDDAFEWTKRKYRGSWTSWADMVRNQIKKKQTNKKIREFFDSLRLPNDLDGSKTTSPDFRHHLLTLHLKESEACIDVQSINFY